MLDEFTCTWTALGLAVDGLERQILHDGLASDLVSAVLPPERSGTFPHHVLCPDGAVDLPAVLHLLPGVPDTVPHLLEQGEAGDLLRLLSDSAHLALLHLSGSVEVQQAPQDSPAEV